MIVEYCTVDKVSAFVVNLDIETPMATNAIIQKVYNSFCSFLRNASASVHLLRDINNSTLSIRDINTSTLSIRDINNYSTLSMRDINNSTISHNRDIKNINHVILNLHLSSNSTFSPFLQPLINSRNTVAFLSLLQRGDIAKLTLNAVFSN
ncbi:hypothetical protein PoB_000734100 [Plakobranchus ocellatus]|uniref:Uncharacterized protein n=1 Tax=Plakobranchus ocellatus TaxID=259542 RepID=A0AAV3YCC0_9GAST|nr:hypothetical protein PoB_000734100 [Plakobranchus ocellatus]